MEPRLWNLYRFIEERTELGEKTKVADICNRFPNEYKLNAKPSNYSNCPNLYKDIDAINESLEVDKIIIKDHNNFHLGTEEEVRAYTRRLLGKATRMFAKYDNIMAKAKNNNQGKLLSNQGNPIDGDSEAKPFHEAYV